MYLPMFFSSFLFFPLQAFQDVLRSEYKVMVRQLEIYQREQGERSIDAQRTDATVPRDTVQLYEQMREAGLEYGPSFRLLRNVHVPEEIFNVHFGEGDHAQPAAPQ